jgi:DNA-binding MarR family transcriptional regulator
MTAKNLELALWLRVLATQQTISRELAAALAPARLGLADYEVLFRVVQAGDGGIRMRELARRVLLSESGLTRLVERLERQGFLRRKSAIDDQRGRACEATDAGIELLRTTQPRFLDALKRALTVTAGLSQQEIATLGRLLAKIATTPDADEHGE